MLHINWGLVISALLLFVVGIVNLYSASGVRVEDGISLSPYYQKQLIWGLMGLGAMITCTLGEKKYTVDYITGRALREMEPAAKMYAKIVAVANAAAKGETVPEEQQFTIPEAMDVMIRWFCLLFGDQFTVDDVLDHYPVDRLMHDVALALLAVQTQTTGILNE